MRAVDITSAQHYRWGAASDGWHLLEIDGREVVVAAGQGISAPRSHGDRVD